jgi:NADH-quinone oxidoreductase subunit I
MKNTCTEEKYASIYEINMLRCIFCGLCEDACPKTIYLTTSKTLVASSYERRFYLWEDRLVMPLDIAMQNAQLKKSQLMSTILIIFAC